MYLSYHFLKSVILGMGFTSGTLISLHLYNFICNEENKDMETNEDDFRDNKDIIKNKVDLTEEINDPENENFWYYLTRRFLQYQYFRI